MTVAFKGLCTIRLTRKSCKNFGSIKIFQVNELTDMDIQGPSHNRDDIARVSAITFV